MNETIMNDNLKETNYNTLKDKEYAVQHAQQNLREWQQGCVEDIVRDTQLIKEYLYSHPALISQILRYKDRK